LPLLSNFIFDKTFLLNGEIIKQEKHGIKDENRAKGEEDRGGFRRKWEFARLGKIDYRLYSYLFLKMKFCGERSHHHS